MMPTSRNNDAIIISRPSDRWGVCFMCPESVGPPVNLEQEYVESFEDIPGTIEATVDRIEILNDHPWFERFAAWDGLLHFEQLFDLDPTPNTIEFLDRGIIEVEFDSTKGRAKYSLEGHVDWNGSDILCYVTRRFSGPKCEIISKSAKGPVEKVGDNMAEALDNFFDELEQLRNDVEYVADLR